MCLHYLPCSALARRGAKWLLLSTADAPLATLCHCTAGDGVHALSAAYTGLVPHHRITSATELVASTEGHLHALLGAAALDHLLCVEAAAATPAAPDTALAYTASMAWVLHARALARQPCKASLVTRGCQPLPCWPLSGCSPALGSLAHGVFKALFSEDRAACGILLDLDTQRCTPSLTAKQLQWLLSDSREHSCALRGSQLYGARLVQQASAPRSRPVALHPGMACVVTGGTRGLGLQYARQLARCGCRTLVLTSRSGMLSRAELADLAQSGE